MTTAILKNIKLNQLEKITTFMGLVGQSATYIQVIKIFYIHSSDAISLIATLISFISMIFWVSYGIKQKIRPLVICNIFGLIAVSLIILGILLYGNNFL
jgi:uncharacterized protein with PQ loop repeat